VLDLFAGTGTTGHAARAEGMRGVLIEQDADHIPLIVSRLDGYRAPAVVDQETGEAEPMDLLDLLGEVAS
jgi:DNA modification methylase